MGNMPLWTLAVIGTAACILHVIIIPNAFASVPQSFMRAHIPFYAHSHTRYFQHVLSRDEYIKDICICHSYKSVLTRGAAV